MAAKKINVTAEEEVGTDVLADEIIRVSKSATALLNSRLSEKAILTLIKAHTGIAEKTIRIVLRGAADLSKVYVKR